MNSGLRQPTRHFLEKLAFVSSNREQGLFFAQVSLYPEVLPWSLIGWKMQSELLEMIVNEMIAVVGCSEKIPAFRKWSLGVNRGLRESIRLFDSNFDRMEP